MVEAKKIPFIQKGQTRCKRVVWIDIPSLIENEVSPKLNFGSLVGLSSFW
jgi:hypothetical protein